MAEHRDALRPPAELARDRLREHGDARAVAVRLIAFLEATDDRDQHAQEIFPRAADLLYSLFSNQALPKWPARKPMTSSAAMPAAAKIP